MTDPLSVASVRLWLLLIFTAARVAHFCLGEVVRADAPTLPALRQDSAISCTAAKMAFDLPLPSPIPGTAPIEIVAVLERDDGWLLARGSAMIDEPGAPVTITLFKAMY